MSVRTRLLTALWILLSCLTARCEVGADTYMASNRSKRIHGVAGQQKAGSDTQNRGQPGLVVDRSPEADAERARIRRGQLYFYDNYCAETTRDRRTKQKVKRSLGKFHLLMIDFLNLDIIDEVDTYSVLPLYLPACDENGDFKERWLYFRTLDGAPEIQDGPRGPVSERFYDSFWQGVTIRICGDGRLKCNLSPRGHLKSTIGGVNQTQWRSLRDPAERHAIRCNRDALAMKFLGSIKAPFESNQRFRSLFGFLKPDNKRTEAWNTQQIQYRIPISQRRGADPTVQTAGNETDLTGAHYDNALLDDVVSEKNSKTATLLEKTRDMLSAMHAQREPDSNLTYNGTRWNADDAAACFVGQPGKNEFSGSLADDCCFFVSTVLDGDQSVPVAALANGLKVSPLGYGKLIWPERWTMKMLRQTRASLVEDWFYNSQYFNQSIGTDAHTFRKEWIRPIPDEVVQDGKTIRLKGMSSAQIAAALKLNIFLSSDTASGKKKQTGKLDYTAALVEGQTPDRRHWIPLDGFREKIPAECIGRGIVDLGVKWQNIARGYGGNFKAGFEETAYTNFLDVVIKEEQKKHGVHTVFAVEQLKHDNRMKAERIRVLARPYCDGMYWWPEHLFTYPIQTDEQKMRGEPCQPYDVMELLGDELKGYHPYATRDDLLDCQAYNHEMGFETDWKSEQKPQPKHDTPGTFHRSQQEHVEQVGLGGYDSDEMRAY